MTATTGGREITGAGGERGCPRCKFWVRRDDSWCPNCGLAYPAGGAPPEYAEAAAALRREPLLRWALALFVLLAAGYLVPALFGVWGLSGAAVGAMLLACPVVGGAAALLERRRRRLAAENLRWLTPVPPAPPLGEIYARNLERVREIDVRLHRMGEPAVAEDLKSVRGRERGLIAGAFGARRRDLLEQRSRAEALNAHIDFVRWQARAALLLYQAQNRLDAAGRATDLRRADIDRLRGEIQERIEQGGRLLAAAGKAEPRPTREALDRARSLLDGLRRQAEELSARRLMVVFATTAIADEAGAEADASASYLPEAGERAAELGDLALTRRELGLIYSADGEIGEAMARLEAAREVAGRGKAPARRRSG